MMKGKRIVKICGALLLTPLAIVMLAAALLYIPPIQRWAVRQATVIASDAMGLDVSIESLHISFPLDLDLHGLHVAEGDKTICQLQHAVVDLNLTHILWGEIGVDAIELHEGMVNTHELIPTLTLEGTLNKLRLSATPVDLPETSLILQSAELTECDLNIALKDTTTTDSTESNVTWSFALSDITIRNSHIALHMPSDSMVVDARIREAHASSGDVQLESSQYAIQRFLLEADSLHYDLPYQPVLAEGLDVNHLEFVNLALELEDMQMNLEPLTLDMRLVRAAFTEKCGLTLQNLTGGVHLTSDGIKVKELNLQTPYSRIDGNAQLQWDALTQNTDAQMMVKLDASLGYKDLILLLSPYMPKGLEQSFPQKAISLNVDADGNVDRLQLHHFTANMPQEIDVRANGYLTQLSKTDSMSASLELDAKTGQLDWLLHSMDIQGVALPPMSLSAQAEMQQGERFSTDLLLTQSRGRMHLVGELNKKSMAYMGRLNVSDINVKHFLPADSIGLLSMHANIRGKGTNLLSRKTLLEALASVDQLNYYGMDVHDVKLAARSHEGKAMLEFGSDNDVLGMSACAEADVDDSIQNASFNLDLNRIDLHALRITPKPLAMSMVLHTNGYTNLHDRHFIDGSMQAIELATPDTVFHPLDLFWNASVDASHTSAQAKAGDLTLDVNSDYGLDTLLAHGNRFAELLSNIANGEYVKLDSLKRELPHLNVAMECGQMNPISNMLTLATGYKVRHIGLNLSASNDKGINGWGNIQSFNTGSILIDTIRWNIKQQDEAINFDLCVQNNRRNKVAVFTSNLNSTFSDNGLTTSWDFIDSNGAKAIDIGAHAQIFGDSLYHFAFTTFNPIIAYRKFTLNRNNFINLSKAGKLDALIDLLADDGTGLKLYTTPDSEADQDVSLSVNHLNIGELAQSLPYLPDIKGFLHGDVHFMQIDSAMTVSTELEASDFYYNNYPLGKLGLNGVYFPNADGSHYIDAILLHNGQEVSGVNGRYFTLDKEEYIEGEMNINHLPLMLVNAFLPPDLMELQGYLDGALELDGTLNKPNLNGNVSTDSMYILAPAYNISLRFPNNTLSIENSYLLMKDLTAYAAGQSPMTMNGYVDFSDLDNIDIDMRLNTKNYQLINAKRTRQALAYGKVFVDVDARAYGHLDNLHVRGDLKVLGNTDATYVLTDSPLTVDDQLADLVTFTDFTDTTVVKVEERKRQNLDVMMNVSIEQGTQIHCLLSDDAANRIDLQGGGDLTLTYDMENDMHMYGRYTILNGLMHYSLMGIPLNNFKITNGSYVEFTSNLWNPTLNIHANTRIKCNVSDGTTPRSVPFNTGVALSKTLQDIGVLFTLESPEDLGTQSELNAMSEDDRNRAAITMLLTGMYISNNYNTTGSYNYTNTLSNYLQSAVNKIASQSGSTVDINVGIENRATSVGQGTDYSFSFAKRFWGNRISLIIGGKLSSGAQAKNTEKTIINNVSVEYMLDNSASRYVRLYYDRNHESLIEGELTEMGAGLILRRKSNKLRDLFTFKKEELRPKKKEKQKKEN